MYVYIHAHAGAHGVDIAFSDDTISESALNVCVLILTQQRFMHDLPVISANTSFAHDSKYQYQLVVLTPFLTCLPTLEQTNGVHHVHVYMHSRTHTSAHATSCMLVA